MKIVIWLGWLLLAFVVVSFLAKYKSHWEFGRYGMPRSLVAADGEHYLDGDDIDPISLGIARTGREEEGYLMAFCLILAGLCWAWYMSAKLHRLKKEAFDMDEIRELIREKSAQGHWDDVKKLRQLLE